MTVSDEAFQELSQRVKKLEDMQAIYRLIAAYGPSVDSGVDEQVREAASGLWVEDGEYNVDVGVWRNRKEIEGMLAGTAHQGYIARGCCHQISAPLVTVNGDEAVAITYSTLMLREGDTYRIDRQAANRWELRRTEQGWRVVRRTNRVIDGSVPAKEILSKGVLEAKDSIGRL